MGFLIVDTQLVKTKKKMKDEKKTKNGKNQGD
jgi:hypothetical protein